MDDRDYRPICLLAVAALAVGVQSLVALFAPALMVLAAFALVLACQARRVIGRYELLGARGATIGGSVAAIVLVTAPTWHGGQHWWEQIQFAAEALPAHERLDFEQLANETEPKLDAFENRPICLKGYAVQNLSPDGFSFSPNGNPTDPRAIKVAWPQDWLVPPTAIAISGTLRVNRRATKPVDRYLLEAAAIRDAKTPIGLAAPWRSGWGC